MANWLVVLLVLGGIAHADKPRTLVVVVAKGSKIKILNRTELRRCFLGDAVVVGDTRLVPFDYQPGTAERVAFDRAVLELSPEQVGRYWVDRKIRGESQPPRALPNATLVTKIVARFPGAIAYVPADQVTDEVQVIAIEGLAAPVIESTSSPAP